MNIEVIGFFYCKVKLSWNVVLNIFYYLKIDLSISSFCWYMIIILYNNVNIIYCLVKINDIWLCLIKIWSFFLVYK